MISMKKSIPNYLILVIFLTSSSSCAYSSKEWESFGQACGLVAAGAAGIYGLYKLIDWCCTRTTVDLLNSGNNLCAQAHQQFQPIFDNQDNLNAEYSCNEKVLAYVANTIVKNESVDSYISALKSLTSQMSAEKQEIDARIAKLKNDKHYYDRYYTIVNELAETSNGLSQLHVCLSKAIKYFNKHKKYLILSHLTKSICITYHCELSAFCKPNFNECLLVSILSHTSSNTKYPYLVYARQIDFDCNKLRKSLAGEYPGLNAEAHNVLLQLEAIKGYVFASERYMQERHFAEQERIELERLALEKQQVALQQQQLQALQIQNALLLQQKLDQDKDSSVHIYIQQK